MWELRLGHSIKKELGLQWLGDAFILSQIIPNLISPPDNEKFSLKSWSLWPPNLKVGLYTSAHFARGWLENVFAFSNWLFSPWQTDSCCLYGRKRKKDTHTHNISLNGFLKEIFRSWHKSRISNCCNLQYPMIFAKISSIGPSTTSSIIHWSATVYCTSNGFWPFQVWWLHMELHQVALCIRNDYIEFNMREHRYLLKAQHCKCLFVGFYYSGAKCSMTLLWKNLDKCLALS